MPTLKTYTANLSGGGQLNVAPAQASPVGAGLRNLGRGLAGAGDTLLSEMEREDSQQAYLDVAKAREQLVQLVDDYHQRGEFASTALAENIDSLMQGARENRTTTAGRAIIDNSTATLATDLGHAARVADASLAGQQAKEQVASTINANGNVLQKDPSQLTSIITEQNSLVDTLPNLTPDQRKEAKRQLSQEAAKNAVRGWIRLNPEMAKQRINDGEWDKYLDADAKDALSGQADTEIRSIETEKRLQASEARLQEKLNQDKLMNQSMEALYSGDLTLGGIGAMARNQVLSPDQISHLYSLKKAMIAAGGSIKSDTGALIHVVNALQNDTLSQDLLDGLAADGQLSQSDYKLYSAAIAEGDTALRTVRKEAMDSVPQSFFGVFPGFPTNADQSHAVIKFDALAREREQEYRTAGKNPMDYYISGEYKKDAMALAPGNSLASGANELRNLTQNDLIAGKPIQAPSGKWYKYNGVNPQTGQPQYVEVPAPEPNTPEAAPLPGVADLHTSISNVMSWSQSLKNVPKSPPSKKAPWSQRHQE